MFYQEEVAGNCDQFLQGCHKVRTMYKKNSQDSHYTFTDLQD